MIKMAEQISSGTSQAQAEWQIIPSTNRRRGGDEQLVPGETDHDWSKRRRQENGEPSVFSPSTRYAPRGGGAGRTKESKTPRKVNDGGHTGEHAQRHGGRG